MRWTPVHEWVWSAEPQHEALITRELFEDAQAQLDRNKRAARRQPSAGREYVLAGLVHCGVCGRRMQGQWNHDRAYCRCRYRDEYPGDDIDHPPSIYVKEAATIPGLDAWLAAKFDDDRIDETCAVLTEHAEPDDEAARREAQLRAGIAECDRKLAKYRALLDHDEARRGRSQVDRRGPARAKSARTPARPSDPRRETHHHQIEALASALPTEVDPV